MVFLANEKSIFEFFTQPKLSLSKELNSLPANQFSPPAGTTLIFYPTKIIPVQGTQLTSCQSIFSLCWHHPNHKPNVLISIGFR